MKIYVCHSTRMPFREELYAPLRASALNVNHEFILPHELNDEPYDSRNMVLSHGCDLMIAEVSLPSTGQGIEMGWADGSHIPIVCIYKAGAPISSALTAVSHDFIEYGSPVDMIAKLEAYINQHAPPS